jgi:hypothetical protein
VSRAVKNKNQANIKAEKRDSLDFNHKKKTGVQKLSVPRCFLSKAMWTWGLQFYQSAYFILLFIFCLSLLLP